MRKRYGFLLAMALVLLGSLVQAAEYPPKVQPSERETIQLDRSKLGLIFSNNHDYGSIEIFVELFDNYLGDTSKYHWVYTVTNHTYDPFPGTTNGFSGFELALQQFVPDLADQDGADANWIFNCCSGQPVEWDVRDAAGLGVMPGEVGVFSFTTLPRVPIISPGWFHSWQFGGQIDVVNYPPGEGPESPDFQDTTPPDVELCCYRDPTNGAIVCEPVPVGECALVPGVIVDDCAICQTIANEKSTWGALKGRHQSP